MSGILKPMNRHEDHYLVTTEPPKNDRLDVYKRTYNLEKTKQHAFQFKVQNVFQLGETKTIYLHQRIFDEFRCQNKFDKLQFLKELKKIGMVLKK